MSPRPAKKKILVVGQTPPPLGGQAMMIKYMLDGSYPDIELDHVRMTFSKEIAECGKVNISKIFELPRVLFLILFRRLFGGAQVLYYPCSGPAMVPVIRDMALLIPTRWLFKRTIFHFHASGHSEFYDRLPAVFRVLFRIAFHRPDAAVHLSKGVPQDGIKLGAKSNYVVPNGIPDDAATFLDSPKGKVPCIFHIGMLMEEKGIRVLVEACRLLKERGLEFTLNLVGMFQSGEFEESVRGKVREYGLDDRVIFAGQRFGGEKIQAFAEADIFCFPTFHPTEGFPVALLEAMSFALPVVTTKWRGLAEVVEDGKSAFLVPIQDPEALAEKLEILVRDGNLRKRMGKRGRERFLENYTVARYRKGLQSVFEAVCQG